VFAGATIHYLVAKIGGTLVFGRGWCGYACWTVAILDLLPWKQPKEGRVPYLGLFRYVHFLGSLGFVLYILFVLQTPPELESLRELYWFLIGNLVYYGPGVSTGRCSERQSGGLQICMPDSRASENRFPFFIDENQHQTGKMRGVLCLRTGVSDGHQAVGLHVRREKDPVHRMHFLFNVHLCLSDGCRGIHVWF